MFQGLVMNVNSFNYNYYKQEQNFFPFPLGQLSL